MKKIVKFKHIVVLVILSLLTVACTTTWVEENHYDGPRSTWVPGHYGPQGRWIRPHYAQGYMPIVPGTSSCEWVPGHYGPRGRWIGRHCAGR